MSALPNRVTQPSKLAGMTHLLERATEGAAWALHWTAWLAGAALVVAIVGAVLTALTWTIAHLYVTTSTRLHVARTMRATRRGA